MRELSLLSDSICGDPSPRVQHFKLKSGCWTNKWNYVAAWFLFVLCLLDPAARLQTACLWRWDKMVRRLGSSQPGSLAMPCDNECQAMLWAFKLNTQWYIEAQTRICSAWTMSWVGSFQGCHCLRHSQTWICSCIGSKERLWRGKSSSSASCAFTWSSTSDWRSSLFTTATLATGSDSIGTAAHQWKFSARTRGTIPSASSENNWSPNQMLSHSMLIPVDGDIYFASRSKGMHEKNINPFSLKLALLHLCREGNPRQKLADGVETAPSQFLIPWQCLKKSWCHGMKFFKDRKENKSWILPKNLLSLSQVQAILRASAICSFSWNHASGQSCLDHCFNRPIRLFLILSQVSSFIFLHLCHGSLLGKGWAKAATTKARGPQSGSVMRSFTTWEKEEKGPVNNWMGRSREKMGN